jgi:hypothetical protein
MFARRPEVAMRRPAPDLIVIDTLGKLAAHGHGGGGGIAARAGISSRSRCRL